MLKLYTLKGELMDYLHGRSSRKICLTLSILATSEAYKMNYRISNTNGAKQSMSYIRVYNDAGEMIAEQAINKRNPVGYIQGVVNSKHKRKLYAQCIQAGMSGDEFYSFFGEVRL